MKTYCLIICLFLCNSSFSQNILISENFEDSNLPSGWTISTNATDGGWNIGTNQTLESQWWSIAPHGNFIGTNDDDCDCDKSMDYLIMPAMDFSNSSAIALQFENYYDGGSFGGDTETATLEYSLNNGNSWSVISEINVINGVGMTTLNEASNKEIAEILLANNANVNARAKGITPLHVAASVNDNDVSKILIINGADINAKDDSEITPLHYAVSFYAKEIVQLLITNGVDLNATDSDYKTALDYAEDFVQVNESANKAKVRIIIAALLRKHGGKTGEELKAEGN